MMLHVRDCPGTTLIGDVCPFPWCRKVKHMLYHLVSCQSPNTCLICSPTDLNGMHGLNLLTNFRLRKRRALIEHMLLGSNKEKVVSDTSNDATIPVSCIEITTKIEMIKERTVMETGSSLLNSSVAPEMLPDQKFNEYILNEQICQRTNLLGNGSMGLNNMPSIVAQHEKQTVERSNLVKMKEGILATSVAAVKSELVSVAVDQTCNSSEFVAHSEEYESIVPNSSTDQKKNLPGDQTSNLSGCSVLNSSIPSTETYFQVLGSSPSTNEPYNTGKSEIIACVENSTSITGANTLNIRPEESNDAMKSATVVTTSESDSEKISTSNVFTLAAKTSKNTTFPSDDSLHSALAPFLADACDATEFQSDTMISNLVPSASISEIAQQFDRSSETSDSVGNNRTTCSFSNCSNEIVETSSMIVQPYSTTTESSEENNNFRADEAASQARYLNCDQSLAIGDGGKESVMPSYNTEPTGIRKDRVSSESLILRVQ